MTAMVKLSAWAGAYFRQAGPDERRLTGSPRPVQARSVFVWSGHNWSLTMKKTIFSLAAMAALTAAAPALADTYHYGYGYADYGYRAPAHRASGWMRSVESRAQQLMAQVEQARYAGRISNGLATSISGKVRANVATAYRYQQGGLSPSEVNATEQRFQAEFARLNWSARRAPAYSYGYGYGW